MTQPAQGEEIRKTVRERYAKGAAVVSSGDILCPPGERNLYGANLYGAAALAQVPEGAALASHGCGNPTAVADLSEGETVLDLGSGGGIDVLLSARRVGPTGTVFGLDMSDEMVVLAKENQCEAGIENVEWLKGAIEQIPLPDASVDVVISNCVIDLSPDKPQIFREVARVLRPGGRLALLDVLSDSGLDEAARAQVDEETGCLGGALTREEFQHELDAAGFAQVEVQETHRVHAHAGSAIVRARKLAPGRL
jgi:SAM-dependent methyltransferase